MYSFLYVNVLVIKQQGNTFSFSLKMLPVILLNYNSSADCKKCISFLQQQEGVDLEIIVVDNCSAPEERQATEQLCHETNCTFIQNDKNAGYNAGNNVGLRYAATKGYEYALIVNPDMEFPQRDYVEKLVGVLNENDNENENPKKYAVVASDIITPKGIHQNPMKPEVDWKSSFGWLTGLFKKQPKDTYSFIDNWQESHECEKVSGCCFLIRMSFLKKIGFFDENVFLYCEEAILSKQVERAGMKMYYTAECQAVHNHVTSAQGNPIPRFKNWRKSRIYYIKKYSNDSWMGKWFCAFSIWMHTNILIIACRIKR